MLRAPSRAETGFDFPARANVTEASAPGANEPAGASAPGVVTTVPASSSGAACDAVGSGRPARVNDSSLIRSSGTSSAFSIWMIDSVISPGPQIWTGRSVSRGTTRFNNSGEILPRSPGQLVPWSRVRVTVTEVGNRRRR